MTHASRPNLLDGGGPTETPAPADIGDYLSEVSHDWSPLRPTAAFATYWRFAMARQKLFYRRLLGHAPPWTLDPVLQGHRFTNAYRASDRVSQYLIRHILYPDAQERECDPQDTLFRILLFKIFNRVGTWEALERSVGEVRWKDYSFDTYDAVLTATLERGERIFSAAYIMPSGQTSYGSPRKHRNCLRLLECIVSGGTKDLVRCESLMGVFRLLRSYPLMGNFLAFQFTIDINYSCLTDFGEDTFVVAGPGALDGIGKCFSNAHVSSPERIIALMAERQAAEFKRLGLAFQSLWGRPLQLVDCQNLFCEVGKYARVAHPDLPGVSGRTRIKQGFRPMVALPLPPPFYPPKWGINQKVTTSLARRRKPINKEA